MNADAVGKNARPYAIHVLAELNGEGLEHTLYTKVEMNPSAVQHSSPQSWSTGTKAFHASRTVSLEMEWKEKHFIVRQYAGPVALRFKMKLASVPTYTHQHIIISFHIIHITMVFDTFD